MSHIYQELTDSELHTIISAHLSGTFSSQKLTGGMFNTTSLITMDNGERYVLRMGPVNRHLLMPFEYTLMQGEALFIQLAKQVGIPTADVIVCDTSRTLIDRDYMLTRYISGFPMTSRDVPKEVRSELQQQVGQLTATLHQVSSTHFGRLSQVAVGKGCQSWSEWVLRAANHWYACTDGLLSDDERKSYVDLFRHYQPLLDAITTPHLIHADLWDGNVLVRCENNRWEVAAIIDGDRALFGDIDFEFASGWMMTDAFYTGYGMRPSDAPDCQIRRTLYKLLYALNDFYICLAEYNKPEDSASHLTTARQLINQLTDHSPRQV